MDEPHLTSEKISVNPPAWGLRGWHDHCPCCLRRQIGRGHLAQDFDARAIGLHHHWTAIHLGTRN